MMMEDRWLDFFLHPNAPFQTEEICSLFVCEKMGSCLVCPLEKSNSILSSFDVTILRGDFNNFNFLPSVGH